MTIELSYENKEALPEAFRRDAVFNELFTVEDDGKVVLSGVTGMKTQRDVDTVKEALRKERKDHGKTKDALRAWGSLNAEETLTQLDRVKELEAAAGGKLDDEKLNELVERRLAQKTGPLERQIKELIEAGTTLEKENAALKSSIESRNLNDSVRSVALESKSHSTAIPDIEMAASVMLEKNDEGRWVTKSDIDGLTPGLDVKGWMKEMIKIRPHWWPESHGGGGRGGGGGNSFSGNNPFSREHWNLTEQGKIMNEQGREVADRMAKAAGTKVGGVRPK